MARSQSTGAIVLAALSVAGIVYTSVAGNSPLLGLDLQGGVSVVYEPTTEATEETLDQTLEIIRDRVDALGVAEPEISRQGNTIVVDLPGVDEQQRALDLVGQTAELRFRPVIANLGPAIDPEILEQLEAGTTDTTTEAGTTDTTEAGSTDTTEPTETTAQTETTASDDDQGLGAGTPRRRRQTTTTTAADDTESTTTTAASDNADTTTTAVDGETTTTETVPLTAEQQALQDEITAACNIAGVTAPEDDIATDYVVLDDADGQRYCLGPSLLTGEALESAEVGLNVTEWFVSPVFKEGAAGIDAFNAVAAQCYVGSPSFNPDVCSTGQLAIVLDRSVISAPNINAASFARDQITISGTFDEESARNLALVLNYGALPVELEAQQVRTVSATIGDDVLVAGIVAGLIGLGVVALYMLWYYRLAGLVALAGLGLSFMMLWTIISWLGESRGLAITLSGVVGLIVSIGVAADSNIVYFENVKDTLREGNARKLGTAVERAYQSAISTIMKAGVVSLIGAGLLYWLTVGAVRGFAFYLGLATILDLVTSTFFMRPALAWIAGRPAVQNNPSLIGVRQGSAS